MTMQQPGVAIARLRKRAAHGFSLISAIFLLVVLTGLGAAMLNFSTMQHSSAGNDIEGTRMYHAARAGIEWALYQKLQGGIGYCPGSGAAVTHSFAFPAGSTLSPYTVTVRCTPTLYNGSTTPAVPSPITIYTFVSTACNQPNGPDCPGTVGPGVAVRPGYVERQVQTQLQAP